MFAVLISGKEKRAIPEDDPLFALYLSVVSILTKQGQDRSLGLSCQRQGLNAQLLTGLKGQQVSTFSVDVSERQFISTSLQGVGILLSKVQTCVQ